MLSYRVVLSVKKLPTTGDGILIDSCLERCEREDFKTTNSKAIVTSLIAISGG